MPVSLPEREQLAELVAEEGFALVLARGLRRIAGARIVEGERVQRIDDRIAALVAAVAGFHADDRGDDLRRHAEARFGARERVAIGRP